MQTAHCATHSPAGINDPLLSSMHIHPTDCTLLTTKVASSTIYTPQQPKELTDTAQLQGGLQTPNMQSAMLWLNYVFELKVGGKQAC